MPVLSFPRSARVRTSAEYARVFDTARRTAAPMLALHWAAGGEGARLGLAVSRKVDKHAVGRNRIKRTLRDVFRHLRGQLPGGDYVLVARPAAGSASSEQLRAAFHGLLVRAGALPPPGADGTMRPAPVPPPSSLSTPNALTG
ncbi:ribonuclease P protein component [Pseudoxanthomonas sp. GM95]|nr:ribonuclease P protein component [Pseudoxanthomonas sp. GM95]